MRVDLRGIKQKEFDRLTRGLLIEVPIKRKLGLLVYSESPRAFLQVVFQLAQS